MSETSTIRVITYTACPNRSILRDAARVLGFDQGPGSNYSEQVGQLLLADDGNRDLPARMQSGKLLRLREVDDDIDRLCSLAVWLHSMTTCSNQMSAYAAGMVVWEHDVPRQTPPIKLSPLEIARMATLALRAVPPAPDELTVRAQPDEPGERGILP